MRRCFFSALLGGALLSTATLGTWAAVINFGPAANISGDADVSTAGTFYGAVALGPQGGPSTNVINGVPFAFPNTSPGSSSTLLSLTSSGSSVSFSAFVPPFNLLSQPYQNLLDSATNGPFVLTINQLTIGNTYAFQLFSNLSIPAPSYVTTVAAGNTITLNQNTTASVGGLGQYAIGTFTADAATQVVSFTGRVNGFQVRTTAVPEPTTALFGAGLLGVAGLARRRARVGRK